MIFYSKRQKHEYNLHTLSTLTTSGGNCIRAELEIRRQIRSTKIPALIACATDRNLGFSSVFLLVVANCLVKVEANHSLTSGGTASGCTSDSSSSSSANRLKDMKIVLFPNVIIQRRHYMNKRFHKYSCDIFEDKKQRLYIETYRTPTAITPCCSSKLQR